MARGMSGPEIFDMHGKAWKVALVTVQRYCDTVRREWRAEALSDDRKLDRDHLRKMLLQVIETAYTIKDTVPVGEFQYEWVDRPDLRAVNTAIQTLMKLDGLDSMPVDAGPKSMDTYITILTQGYGVSAERLAPLKAALASMSGNGPRRPAGLPRKALGPGGSEGT